VLKKKIFAIMLATGMILVCFSLIGTQHSISSATNHHEGTEEQSSYNVQDSTDCGCSNEEIQTSETFTSYQTGLLPGGSTLPEGKTFTGVTPPTWDWRNAEHNGITGDWTTGVRNQGNCGSCYSFAALASFESVIKITRNNPTTAVDLSEQFIVSCGSEWMQGDILGCDGGYFDATFEFIDTYGAIPETCFPYVSGGSGYVPPCSQKCSNWQSLVLNIDNWQMVAPDLTSLKNALITYGPLTTSFIVYDDFFDYDGGVYEHPGVETDPTNHMVAIVGYDDANHCWICKNSWGTGWGEYGWFRIAYGDCRIGEETAYLEYTDESAPSVTVTIHRIKMIGEIEGILEDDADWSYRVQVFDGYEWKEEINDAYSENEDDHTQDVSHTINIFTTTPEITIKVWDRDFWTEDDLADISGYEGGGADNDITDRRGAIYHGTYDITTNHIIPIDTVITEGAYATTSGTYPPDNGDNSDEENDAKVWFTISDNYEPPDPDLEVTGSLDAGNVSKGTLQYHLGSFTVKNIGVDPSGIGRSYLDWEIAETPSWGTNWQFTPNSGTNLPDGQLITVEVYVDIPNEKGDFSGQIKIWNAENHQDYGTVPVHLKSALDLPYDHSTLLNILFRRLFSSIDLNRDFYN
jgi:C1A family cysteine protease